MADFTRIKEQDVWINLDYVVRIEPNAADEGSTTVVFADGTSFSISNADGKRLLRRLRPPKKGEEDKSATVTFADGTSFKISNADGERLLKKFSAPKKKKKKKKKTMPPVPAPDASEPDVAEEEAAPPGEEGV